MLINNCIELHERKVGAFHSERKKRGVLWVREAENQKRTNTENNGLKLSATATKIHFFQFVWISKLHHPNSNCAKSKIKVKIPKRSPLNMTVNSCSNRPPLLELEKSEFERKIGSRTELTSQSQPNSKNVASSVWRVGVFVEKENCASMSPELFAPRVPWILLAYMRFPCFADRCYKFPLNYFRNVFAQRKTQFRVIIGKNRRRT